MAVEDLSQSFPNIMKVWEDLLPLPHNTKQRPCTLHVGRVTANQKTSYAGGPPLFKPATNTQHAGPTTRTVLHPDVTGV